jgi:hypothetical protein
VDANERYDKAVTALLERSNQWHCIPCWSTASGVSEKHVRAIGHALKGSPEYEVRSEGGACHVHQGTVEGDIVIRARQEPRLATPS